MSTDALLEALDVAVYSKDLEGRYTYANRYVCTLFGAELADIVGKDDSHFFDLEQSNALRINDQEVLTTGATVRREEHDVIRETGEERIYWTVKTPLFDEAGTIVGMCGLSVDITPDR